jgi:hypothetical protein
MPSQRPIRTLSNQSNSVEISLGSNLEKARSLRITRFAAFSNLLKRVLQAVQAGN